MIQKEDERKEREYLTLVPESWIYLPGSFEDRGNRSCAACEQNNNLANNNNKKSGKYEEAEPDSKLIPRVPCKKNNPKPDKIRQKILLVITAYCATVSFARSLVIQSSDTSIKQMISEMNSTLSITTRVWTGVLTSVTLL